MTIATADQRLAGFIGQIIVENAKLAAEVEQLRLDLVKEQERAGAAEHRLKLKG